MANQLQNIQVSYQQTSRGSGSSNQNYMRTRRLSVPAAEIRNRPRLLELFNEATARQLREKDDESDDDYDDDEQINIAKQRQIPLRQRQRTLASIDDHKESASDNDGDDNEQMDSLKQESKSSDKIDGNDQLQATTTTNSCDDDNSDQKDDVSDNNSSTRDNYLINDRQQQSSEIVEKKWSINSISESHRLKIQMFYQKLVKKLLPFEDRTWRRKFIEKIQELYCLLCMLLFTIR